jgi:hypothetical protein
VKFDCGPTRETKLERLQKWHLWFAWHPVRLGENDCRWLEWVQRKGKYWGNWAADGWDWEYQEATK